MSIFYFVIQHRPEPNHGNADGVSRIPWEQIVSVQNQPKMANKEVNSVSSEEKTTRTWCQRWSDSDMQLHQYEDPELGRAIRWVQEGQRPPREEIASIGPIMVNLWNKFSALLLVEGLLYRSFGDERGDITHLQLCLPRKLIKAVLASTHNIPSAGHLGSQKMAQRISRRFYWSGCRTDIETHCRACRKSPVKESSRTTCAWSFGISNGTGRNRCRGTTS